MLVKQIPSDPRIPLQLHGAFPSHGGTPSYHPFIVGFSIINHPLFGTFILGTPHPLAFLRAFCISSSGEASQVAIVVSGTCACGSSVSKGTTGLAHHRPRQAFSVKGLEKVGKFHRKYGNFELNFKKIGILDGHFIV